MLDLENDLIELILWEEQVVSFIKNIQRERDGFYRILADDYKKSQWGEVRRLKVFWTDKENLTKIIEACNEVMAYNVRIELLRAEISRRPSRREMFEKPRYEGTVWSDYQGFSNELYQNVRYESQKELEITNHVLKFLPSLFPIHIISNVEAVINMFENFRRLNYIDELTDKNRIKFNL